MQCYRERFIPHRGLNLPQTFGLMPLTFPLMLHTFAIGPQTFAMQVHTGRIACLSTQNPFRTVAIHSQTGQYTSFRQGFTPLRARLLPLSARFLSLRARFLPNSARFLPPQTAAHEKVLTILGYMPGALKPRSRRGTAMLTEVGPPGTHATEPTVPHRDSPTHGRRATDGPVAGRMDGWKVDVGSHEP